MRNMKALLLAAVVGTLLLSPLADARDRFAGFGMQAQGEAMKKGPGGQPPRGERDKRGGRDKQHQGRLTEEQRRDLHRDLDRANREIYRR